MPFKNAVVYILLYGTAERYYFQKTLDKDCTVPTMYGTRHITKHPKIGLMRDLNAFFSRII